MTKEESTRFTRDDKNGGPTRFTRDDKTAGPRCAWDDTKSLPHLREHVGVANEQPLAIALLQDR